MTKIRGIHWHLVVLLAGAPSFADTWNTSVSGSIYPTSSATKLGLGSTTAPDRTLVVNGQLGLYNANSGITWKNTASANKLWDISTSNANFNIHETGILTRLSFKPGGSVELNSRLGIGTSLPEATLHLVQGSGEGQAIRVVSRTGNRAIFLDGGPAMTKASLRDKWNVDPTDNVNGVLSFITNDWDNSNGLGFIKAANVASPVLWMYTSDGRNAFTVAKKGYSGTGSDASQIDDKLTPLFQVRESGNVGIGTSFPASLNGRNRVLELSAANAATNAMPGFVLRGGSSYSSLSAWETLLSSGATGYTDYQILGGANAQLIIRGNTGNVGIGSTTPEAKLHVVGDAKISGNMTVASITTKSWSIVPDYVFEKDYKLRPLDSVAAFVDKHKHLPEVPSAKELNAKGMNLAEMNLTLLKKVEELTLYMVDQQQEIRTLKQKMANLER